MEQVRDRGVDLVKVAMEAPLHGDLHEFTKPAPLSRGAVAALKPNPLAL